MRTFRSLRHPNYRLYFVGQLVSLIGSWTQITTLTWLAFKQTDSSATWPALLAAVQIGPTFLLGPWGGALADRMPRRGLIVRTQSAFLMCALILLGLYLTDQLSVGAMLAVMFAHGVVQAIDLPARLAFVPSLVGREDMSNAVALNSLLFNVARAVGPAIAAILLASAGAYWCFVVNALSYLAVIGALVLIRVPPDPIDAPPPSTGGGFRFLSHRPGLLTLVLLAGLVACGGWPMLALLPSVAGLRLGRGEAGYGTLLSSVGMGALAAALMAATVGNDVRRKVLLLGGLINVALALAGLSITHSLAMASGCCVLFGFGMILFFATGQTLVQLGTPDADRGKVMGVWAMMLSAGVPLGNLVFGPAADLFTVPAIITVQACVISVAAVLLLFRRIE
ncbi:MAG TPA: MFS transporter [Gemmataceae bacterium]|jgi:predicted MFS family arabinose efflux permease|nr:MFS transporter [Gemmataceae bacterium]